MRKPQCVGGVVALVAGALSSVASSQVQVHAPDQLALFQGDKGVVEANPQRTTVPNSLLVKFNEKTPQQAVAGALAAAGATPVRSYGLVPGLVHARTDAPVERVIEALAANGWVEYAEPDYVQRAVATFANDTFFSLQWGLDNTGQDILGDIGVPDADIDMPEAWDIMTGDANMVVAIIDSGTQWSHPDLDTNIWSNPGEIGGNGIDDDGNGFVDDTVGWDFYDNDNNPDDGDGHGTHTAGTVGAEGNNNEGVTGVMWDCQIMVLRFLGPNGTGSTSDAIACVDYAIDNGCIISNNSWGGGGFSTSLYNSIAAGQATDHVFVAAAGNSGLNTDSSPHYPSSYDLDNIISVCATDNQDNLVNNSTWASNYGPTSVDIAAPGNNIASTWTGGSYVWSSGTSMAAPHVAGVVAMVQSQNPGWSYTQVIDRVLDTARPNSALSGLCVTGGVLNAFGALDSGGPGNTPPTVTISSPGNGSTFTEGDSVTFTGSASDTEDGNLSSSITWSSNLDGSLGSGASITTSGLSVGTHIVTADVSDSDGASDSDSVTVTIESAGGGGIPAPPSNLTLTDLGNRYVEIAWTDNSNNEDGFDIQRERLRRGSWNQTTNFTVGADVTSGVDRPQRRTYRYRVRAFNASGDSAWTNWVEITVN